MCIILHHETVLTVDSFQPFAFSVLLFGGLFFFKIVKTALSSTLPKFAFFLLPCPSLCVYVYIYTKSIRSFNFWKKSVPTCPTCQLIARLFVCVFLIMAWAYL